jgi:hypothetical protein
VLFFNSALVVCSKNLVSFAKSFIAPKMMRKIAIEPVTKEIVPDGMMSVSVSTRRQIPKVDAIRLIEEKDFLQMILSLSFAIFSSIDK